MNLKTTFWRSCFTVIYLNTSKAIYYPIMSLMSLSGQTVNEAFKERASGEDLADYLDDISASLGYAIAPDDTWVSLTEKIANSQVIPRDYQTIFDNFNRNAELNKEAAQDFSGVFNDINLVDSRQGASTTARAKSLNSIVKLVDEIDYHGTDGKDVLGEIYEYLIGQFAASAGKKGGEFYPPIRSVRFWPSW